MDELGTKYLALLRGINIGGKNILQKITMKDAFEALGFTNIRTYIQSGNILFRTNITGQQNHVKRIEEILANRYSINTKAVVYSESQFKTIVEKAPNYWGKNRAYRHRILFLLDNISPNSVLDHLGVPERGVEMIDLGSGVVYSSVLKTHLSKSVMRKFPTTSAYQKVTVRNHNTVLKLYHLFDEI